jgi:hypothetical protein
MKKSRTIIYVFSIVIAMVLISIPAAFASDIDSGAKLLRAEWQGVELSKDKQNPTVLEIIDDWPPRIDLIGNRHCGSLKNALVWHVFGAVDRQTRKPDHNQRR